MLINLVILWCCVGVFVATAIITLLALTKVLELADKKYLDILFKTLIVEIVIVGVGMFSGFVESPNTITENLKEEGYATGHEKGLSEGHNAAVREFLPKLEAVQRDFKKLTDSSVQLTPAQKNNVIKDINASLDLTAMRKKLIN